jgi:hypothetical protein
MRLYKFSVDFHSKNFSLIMSVTLYSFLKRMPHFRSLYAVSNRIPDSHGIGI